MGAPSPSFIIPSPLAHNSIFNETLVEMDGKFSLPPDEKLLLRIRLTVKDVSTDPLHS
jgi:hypothetical protein